LVYRRRLETNLLGKSRAAIPKLEGLYSTVFYQRPGKLTQ